MYTQRKLTLIENTPQQSAMGSATPPMQETLNPHQPHAPVQEPTTEPPNPQAPEDTPTAPDHPAPSEPPSPEDVAAKMVADSTLQNTLPLPSDNHLEDALTALVAGGIIDDDQLADLRLRIASRANQPADTPSEGGGESA